MNRRDAGGSPNAGGPDTTGSSTLGRDGLIRALRGGGGAPIISVELRPPRADLDAADGIDAWIDLNHAIRRFTGDGRFVFLTDDAVGVSEEETLGHLDANLDPGIDRSRLVPFLTCKHSLAYCQLYAERAHTMGLAALTVVGGDPRGGAPRCLPHAWQLREKLRERVPALGLGGWANPFRAVDEQAGFLLDPRLEADFVLTQVVSHHDAGHLTQLISRIRAEGFTAPILAGVFHYRSANPRTLSRLADFLPVPAEGLTAEFDRGLPAEEVTARSVRAALESGADGVYVSNLRLRDAPRVLGRILERAGV